MSVWGRVIVAGWLATVTAAAGVNPVSEKTERAATVEVPRIDRAPKLEDFSGMAPAPWLEGRMAKITDFVQWVPRDGQPASQRTEAYLAYDHEHLYVVVLCFDTEPEKIRARLSRREDIMRDDRVDLFLDTFHDGRRAYEFTVNPYGVQADATWTERDRNQYDTSFDTVWYTEGKLTPQGYIIWVAIPFRSLRFPSKPVQEWGIILARWITRANEGSFWPYVTTRIEGRLGQSARLTGLRDISPGGWLHLIPYGFFRSFRKLEDEGFGATSRWVEDRWDPDAGLDAKFLLRGNFAVDVAMNPDFNQIESDEPQVTVNQRFELFFPEKRPFFLENANTFETPINLFFSRRIADPRFGVRLTGKSGPYSVGALYADDESAGEAVPPDHPDFDRPAHFGIFRVNRDLAKQSSIGFLFTDREHGDSSNRVGAADARLKLTQNWVVTVQAARSSTEDAELDLTGSAVEAWIQRTGRQLTWSLEYSERSTGFRTLAGFLPGSQEKTRAGRPRNVRVPLRPGIRSGRHFISYRFRPEGEKLIAWGPDISVNPSWTRDGRPLDLVYSLDMSGEFARQTYFGLFYTGLKERLGPEDSDQLDRRTAFSTSSRGVYWSSNLSQQFGLQGEFSYGTQVNLVPPVEEPPVVADSTQGNITLYWYPAPFLRVENTYILARLKARDSSASVFNNHIARSKFNCQFNRELSIRTILQYEAVLANPGESSLETNKNLNVDVLFTWLRNPWTALYVGYNNNRRTLGPLYEDGTLIMPRTTGMENDSWQFFVKLSWFLAL